MPDRLPDPSTKLKDLRQLEQRLKNKEEQLKIKEAMMNDDLKDKEKILERLFKAENRNFELEQTIKTLNRRISILEVQPTQQVKETNSQRQNNELDKLLSNNDQTKDNPTVVTDFVEPISNNSKVDQPISRNHENISLTPAEKAVHCENNHPYMKQQHFNTSYINNSDVNHVQYISSPTQMSQNIEVQHSDRDQTRTNNSLTLKPDVPPHQNLATSRPNCKVGQPIFYTKHAKYIRQSFLSRKGQNYRIT
ncbi:unnamed protein product [Mytilus edulis]|uniref:Uncharacterized protein n=1 Tax=Mytilus edulis TaxID=6550 RepID=A0A8S3SVC1_MYTED|nr:unnamed protein product [Mytilus edulis]